MALDERTKTLICNKIKPEDVARLWMNENAVVNQKTSYFIVATAFVGTAISTIALADPARIAAGVQGTALVFFCLFGLLIGAISVSSIMRTCDYRDHLRECLNEFDEYKALLTPQRHRWLSGISSSALLIALPTVVIVAWFTVLVFIFARLLRG